MSNHPDSGMPWVRSTRCADPADVVRSMPRATPHISAAGPSTHGQPWPTGDAIFRAAIEAMTDAVFVSDIDGRLVLMNEAFASFHRFPSREVCACTLHDYPALLDVSYPSGRRPMKRSICCG